MTAPTPQEPQIVQLLRQSKRAGEVSPWRDAALEHIDALRAALEEAQRRLDKLERVSMTGSVQNWLKLPDEVKAKTFALLVEQSSLRKKAEERVAELEEQNKFMRGALDAAVRPDAYALMKQRAEAAESRERAARWRPFPAEKPEPNKDGRHLVVIVQGDFHWIGIRYWSYQDGYWQGTKAGDDPYYRNEEYVYWFKPLLSDSEQCPLVPNSAEQVKDYQLRDARRVR